MAISLLIAASLHIDTIILRCFCAARMLRLGKSLAPPQKQFGTLVMCLLSPKNVGAMLPLLFNVYAVAGMALCSDVQIEGNVNLPFMNANVNFGSFYLLMVMLFRMNTGELWNGIMHDCFSGARCLLPALGKMCSQTLGVALTEHGEGSAVRHAPMSVSSDLLHAQPATPLRAEDIQLPSVDEAGDAVAEELRDMSGNVAGTARPGDALLRSDVHETVPPSLAGDVESRRPLAPPLCFSQTV